VWTNWERLLAQRKTPVPVCKSKSCSAKLVIGLVTLLPPMFHDIGKAGGK